MGRDDLPTAAFKDEACLENINRAIPSPRWAAGDVRPKMVVVWTHCVCCQRPAYTVVISSALALSKFESRADVRIGSGIPEAENVKKRCVATGNDLSLDEGTTFFRQTDCRSRQWRPTGVFWMFVSKVPLLSTLEHKKMSQVTTVDVHFGRWKDRFSDDPDTTNLVSEGHTKGGQSAAGMRQTGEKLCW